MKTFRLRDINSTEVGRFLLVVFGSLIYGLGMNLFIVPAGLYSGGVMGIAQLLRTLIIKYTGLTVTGFDIAGIVYYIINIPILILAYKSMGKLFFIKTALAMTMMTIALSFIPIPAHLLIADDVLTSCIFGAIISGAGSGFILMAGGSSGGMDVIGVYCIKKRGNYSVGKLSLMMNLFIYAVCLYMFDVSIVMYSVIFAAIYSFALDRIHTQNINVEAIIITKSFSREMQQAIFNELGRGITKWETMGAYTGEPSEVLFLALSKYEINQMKRIVKQYDPNAFIVIHEGVSVDGNFTRKL